MMRALKIDLPSLDATRAFAESVASSVLVMPESDEAITIAMNGTLGTGKTQWVRYFCNRLGVPEEEVTSPTYVLLQRYVGRRTIHHFDFYRLESTQQVWDLGIDELYEQPGIVLIEWADKFRECLPDDCLTTHFEQASNHSGRTATITATGAAAEALMATLEEFA